MSSPPLSLDGKLNLPLITGESSPAAPSWEGWSPLTALPDAPEPLEPQGEYASAVVEAELPLVDPGEAARPVELLAPAGGPDAGFAALHFGADAIYLGLKKFSARAEAENFTLEELDEITAYAHSLQPARRVFVTVNTLLRQDELPELIDTLHALDEIGVDAVILQDLGVYRLLRDHFPRLERHASTQLAVHNRAGAEMLRRLGFQRVVLARELTYEEIRDVTASAGIETEVFIHGALCYSYSGLCLFSAQTLGRSGNRGKCAYSCRDSYAVQGAPLELRDGNPVKRDPRQGFPFSMKDLALPDHLPALRAAGVSCFKIEGRKKGPLYVATTTDYYRRLLDGRLDPAERSEREADLQTVFSRPWTQLFVQSHRDKEVADRDTVGHRGTLVGKVEAITRVGGEYLLRFHTARPLEKHDGLQIDLPRLGRPFGFAVDRLYLAGSGKKGRREVFEGPAGAAVEVLLPEDRPDIPVGAPVYCSSSQQVKRRYRHERPRPGLFHVRRALDVRLELTPQRLVVEARVPSCPGLEARRELPGPFAPARDVEVMRAAARDTFSRLGETCFQPGSLELADGGLFVPQSRLNQLRRELVAELQARLEKERQRRLAELRELILPPELPARPVTQTFRWSIKVDRIGHLDALEDADLQGLDEIVVDIARDHPTTLAEKLQAWAGRIGRDRLRLALPPLTRAWEDKGVRHKIALLRSTGWQRWKAANLSAWSYLDGAAGLDLAADWPLYVLNRHAALALRELGVRRFVLSPEDGLANWESLLREFASDAVLIVYQDTPLFLAESCAYANLIGGCPGKANCKFESMEMVSSHGEKVLALDYHCRTIVLNQGPYCLSTRLADLARAGAVHLRADFLYRPYTPEQVRDLWRRVRAGQPVPAGHSANCDRGIL